MKRVIFFAKRLSGKRRKKRYDLCLGLKLVHPYVVHTRVGLTGAVFVAFAAELDFSRQMSATGS